MDLGVRVRCNDDESNSIRLKYKVYYYDNILVDDKTRGIYTCW